MLQNLYTSSVGDQGRDGDGVRDDNLHGADIVGEKLYLIKGNSPQSLDWSEYGFRMLFPQDTLPPDDTCEVTVHALIGEDFGFPEGTELVSGVYSVSFAKEIGQPIRVEIQHCVALNDADGMIFAATDSQSEVFKPVIGAEFFPDDNRYGIVNQLHFCRRKLAVLQKKTSTNFLRYFGILFYTTVNLNYQWTVHFFAMRAIKTNWKRLMNELKSAQTLSTIEFQFKSNGYLELILSEPKPSGWILTSHTEPLCLSKSKVDTLKVSSPYESSCRITVFWNGTTEDAKQLSYPIELRGIKCLEERILIILSTQTLPDGSTVQPAGGVDSTILEPSDQSWLEVLSETKDITDWNILSIVLGVSNADLQRIKSDNPGQTFSQQQTIVKAWLNSGKASWASLVNALRHELVNQGGHASRITKKHIQKS